MKRISIFLGLTLLLIVAIVVAVRVSWHETFPSYTWHYRITVVAETPEGLKSGSAVREVSYARGLRISPEQIPIITCKGEAVVVDLGQRGLLFLLVDGDYCADILFKVFPKGKIQGKVTLKPEQYPNFVRFRDLNDPKTIENVRADDELNKFKVSAPRRPVVAFETAFGDGVQIKEVTIEITSDPVTWGIEKFLPWVLTVGDGTLSGKQFNTGLEWYDQLGKWEFKREQQ